MLIFALCKITKFSLTPKTDHEQFVPQVPTNCAYFYTVKNFFETNLKMILNIYEFRVGTKNILVQITSIIFTSNFIII